MSLFHVCAVPLEEEGVRSPGTGVRIVMSYSMGAGNETPVLGKNS